LWDPSGDLWTRAEGVLQPTIAGAS
jgi:hypothetical protein